MNKRIYATLLLTIALLFSACNGNKIEKIVSDGFTEFYKQVELINETKGDIDPFFKEESYLGLEENEVREIEQDNKNYIDYVDGLKNYFTDDMLDQIMRSRELPNPVYYLSGYKKADFKLNSLKQDGEYYKINYTVNFTGDNELSRNYEYKIKITDKKISFAEGPLGIN